VAGIALGRDLVNGQVDVLGGQLEEVVEYFQKVDPPKPRVTPLRETPARQDGVTSCWELIPQSFRLGRQAFEAMDEIRSPS
jgi:hypothetical protein